MSGASRIAWTDVTWNPVTGCTQVSPGCDHCYALRLHNIRHQAWLAGRFPSAPAQYHQPFAAVQVFWPRITDPLHWRKPRRVFVNSMSDLFHAQVPTRLIAAVFAVAGLAPRHQFQILTKRPARMRRLLTDEEFRHLVRGELRRVADAVAVAGIMTPEFPDDWPLPNVWLGVSVETQEYTYRIDELRETPAAIRFLSCEPLLGPLDLTPWLDRIDWVIVGGESGGPAERALVARCGWCGNGADAAMCPSCHGARWLPKPEALDWVRGIRDQCVAAGVPYFFKQWGGPRPTSGGRLLDGREWNEYPEAS